jgi:hypothetical protein
VAKKNEFPLSILENLNQLTDQFTVMATNSTSGNKISKIKEDVTLIALSKSGVTLEMPKRSCSQGHSLILQIDANVTNAEGEPVQFHIQVTGVIGEIEGDIQERFQVKLEFRQYSVEEWQRFLGHVENRQTDANRLLRKMKQ